MTIDSTNASLFDKLNGLESLAASDRVMPAGVAYAIVKSIMAMRTALEPCKIVREQIIRRYADGGTTITREADPERFDACKKELDEIGNKRITVDVEPVKLDEIRKANFTLKEMEGLMILISEE